MARKKVTRKKEEKPEEKETKVKKEKTKKKEKKEKTKKKEEKSEAITDSESLISFDTNTIIVAITFFILGFLVAGAIGFNLTGKGVVPSKNVTTTTIETTVQTTTETTLPTTTTINDEPLSVIVLNDRNCSTCDPSYIMSVTRRIFPSSNITVVDISSDEGKALLEKYEILMLPAYIFGSNLPSMRNYQRNAPVFEKRNDAYILKPEASGADHYVSEEAKQKALEKLCSDIEKVEKPNFKIFYMSFCPYGIQAMKAVGPVANLLGNKAEIEPHFVIYENYAGGGPNYCIENGQLCSMHGIKELNEDIRQACVWKYEKDKFWNYTMCVMNDCSLNNIDTCWETCADKTGIDKDSITECQTNEGSTLMKEERNLNKQYGVTGSPTMFLNDNPYRGRRTSEDIKNYICCSFKDRPEECDTSLSSNAATTSGGCGG